MIKVLFFIEKLAYNGAIGGAEKALITLVNQMDPNQFDITVQTVFPDEKSNLLNNNVRYRYCYSKKNDASVLLYRVEAEFGLTYLKHIKDDYDIEVAYLEFDTTKVIAASTNKKAKKVAWVHCDFNIAIADKKAFVSKTEKYYKKYDRIVCVSEQCKKSFDNVFGSRYDSIVLHNVIDEKNVQSKADETLPSGVTKSRYTICSVSNFTPAKNHLRLLKACKRLAETGIKYDLWLIGDGTKRQEIEEYIRSNNMQSHVKLFGFQDNPYPFMKQADLLACSSDYEGYSTFVVEGIILGKRIITTDCSGMHELLDGYEKGTIVLNDDLSFFEGLLNIMHNTTEEKSPSAHSINTKSSVIKNENFFKDLV